MGHRSFEQNLNCVFQFSLHKNSEISSSRQEGQNFKFYWLVLPKRWITWAKNWHSILGLWKVSAQSEFWFPIQTPQNGWISFEQTRRPKFQILSVGFVWKINFLGKKLRERFTVLTLKCYKKFQQNLNPGFQFSTKELGEFSLNRQEGQNFKFIALFCLKDKLLGQKTYASSLLSWH